jgi:hypothetical protein
MTRAELVRNAVARWRRATTNQSRLNVEEPQEAEREDHRDAHDPQEARDNTPAPSSTPGIAPTLAETATTGQGANRTDLPAEMRSSAACGRLRRTGKRPGLAMERLYQNKRVGHSAMTETIGHLDSGQHRSCMADGEAVAGALDDAPFGLTVRSADGRTLFANRVAELSAAERPASFEGAVNSRSIDRRRETV